MTDQPRLTGADRAMVLGWVADALDGARFTLDLSNMLRDAAEAKTGVPLFFWRCGMCGHQGMDLPTQAAADAQFERHTQEQHDPAPVVGLLYEFHTLVAGEPAGTHVGWWDGKVWIACVRSSERAWWLPGGVTGFRPYNPSVAEPVPVGPMLEPTTFGAMVDTDDGPMFRTGYSTRPWLTEDCYFRDWTDLRNPRPYKADGAVQ